MKVRYLQRALYEIDRSLGYVKRRSPAGAAKIEARLMIVLDLLNYIRTLAPRREFAVCAEFF